MAFPSIPQNLYVQTANGQVFLSWDISSGATGYYVQRSTDNVNFSALATVSSNVYLDTAVLLGVQYFYKVASTNAGGTSPYTPSQDAIPVPAGEMCLGQLRLAAQQRCDKVNSEFVTLPEWNFNINQSLFELYDLLVTTYDDYFVAPALTIPTDGVSALYALPNGSNYSGAAPFYKLMGVDLGVSNSNNGWVSMDKFNFADRNQYFYPNSGSTIYGVFNCKYRLLGTNSIEFIPTPSAGQNIRLWYIPRLTMLLKDTDTTSAGISGWMEYVIVDAAIKALVKEESDVSALAAQKLALIKRIQDSAMNRDAGRGDTISDTSSPWGGNSSGYFKGGF